ncbi:MULTISPECIES: molybdopterin-binding/glycosyltransferase family 2 protein [unclassified Rhizobium]|uniref:NTP transferase domain-containing protein n=1 Tax=unclassified Rhizobium TaxID=2613769 RepID=UPI000EAA8F0F|nr:MULTISPECIES: molybdopterin-binding/glycosyltransferase family 2 protein [unclassified Rhizobium]AYG66385.1 4-diphosphocytidyl-2C-methyl-D-erythritol kinase [Rhizobium sp. CCGE531]AYG72766.1 4-diphosphocytidyl-2C-methyl-D-erythritol kinase [Rhizobium sp. CCGE532]
MIFGEFQTVEAEGAVLAHSIRISDGSFSKGHKLAGGDIERLAAAGIERVIAARIEPGDLMEDEAAERLARAIAPDHLTFSKAATGRVNVHSAVDGLFVANRAAVDQLNSVDPAITLACLADRVPVRSGDMVATFKIIPLAVPGAKVAEGVEILRRMPVFEVKPFAPHAISLVATELPSLKASVMDKTARILSQRLQPSGSVLQREERVAHRANAVADAICRALEARDQLPKLVVVFGASAVIDAGDVIPEAIRLAGGEVIQVGMPVDPGNLLVLGRVGGVHIVGAPGCARSPKENGFDWVLDRILAGERPTSRDISGMGVGGLLMEIQSRPRPRDIVAKPAARISVAVVLLAAGKASRMGEGGSHKLLAEFDGVPLVRRSASIAIASGASDIVAVTGHRCDEIEDALRDLAVEQVFNPDYASGMASSLVAGVGTQAAQRADGVLVMLADMPSVTSDDLKTLIAAFREANGQAIVRAASAGKRGNPVILPRSVLNAVVRLEGDVGARHIIETSGLPVIDVEIGKAAHLDVDTPEAVVAAGGVLKG